jgi:hypothetical protein
MSGEKFSEAGLASLVSSAKTRIQKSLTFTPDDLDYEKLSRDVTGIITAPRQLKFPERFPK